MSRTMFYVFQVDDVLEWSSIINDMTLSSNIQQYQGKTLETAQKKSLSKYLFKKNDRDP